MVDGLFIVPNWSQSVSETYEFATDIFVSRSGKEQRAVKRAVPRRTLSFSGQFWKEDYRRFGALLEAKGAQSVELLDHAANVGLLVEAVVSGESSVVMLRNYPWATAGRRVALTFGSTVIRAEIASVAGKTLTFTVPFEQDVPVDATILPRIETLMRQDHQMTARSDRLVEVPISAMVKPGTQTLDDLFKPVDDFPAVDDRPVLTISPNWARSPTYTVATTIDRVDYGNLVQDYAPETVFKNTMQLSFLDRAGAEAHRILNLFLLSSGRAGEFWAPSWMSDVVPQGKMAEGSSRVKVKDDVLVTPSSGGVAIFFDDGTVAFRKIDRVTFIGAGEGFKWLNFTEPFDSDHWPEEVTLMCWMRLCRFASDSLTIEWITDMTAQVQVTLRTLEDLIPDEFPLPTYRVSLADEDSEAMIDDDDETILPR